jgi:hypothetical protein
MAEPARKRAEKVVGKRVRSHSAALSKKDAAKTLASMIEQQMADLRLPEEEKNRRVAKFGERVDRATASHAKS